jgi:hypothetical protein
VPHNLGSESKTLEFKEKPNEGNGILIGLQLANKWQVNGKFK